MECVSIYLCPLEFFSAVFCRFHCTSLSLPRLSLFLSILFFLCYCEWSWFSNFLFRLFMWKSAADFYELTCCVLLFFLWNICRENFTSSFFTIWVSFSCLSAIGLAELCWVDVMKAGLLALLLILVVEILSVSPIESDVHCGFFIFVINYIEIISFYFIVREVFL